MIQKPYLLFLGDVPDQLAAKVAIGINEWRPREVVGKIGLDGCKAVLDVKQLTVEEAVAAGAKTMVVGVANRGGVILPSWNEVLESALEAGLDLASGLHNFLSDEPTLVKAAERNGRRLLDVRMVTDEYPIASGRKRSGKRCLTVGTDVSVGKMFATLAMQREMKARGMKATFRATGQTGILIEGSGVPLDAVVADFMSGSIEALTPDNDEDHWDMIEGQGSLFHASYSGVTLALIHGGQPDALILCHDATRKHARGLKGYRVPDLEPVRDLALEMAHMVNSKCEAVGVSINTSGLSDEDARAYIFETEDRLELPTTDPIRFGVKNLVDSLQGL